MKVTVEEKPAGEYRVSTGEVSDRARHFATEKNARACAERLASFGAWCQLEIRRQKGALWSLINTYEPRRGGRFKVVDPYTAQPAATLEEAVVGHLIKRGDYT